VLATGSGLKRSERDFLGAKWRCTPRAIQQSYPEIIARKSDREYLELLHVW